VANKKISQLPVVTNAALGNSSVFPVVDSTDETTKQILVTELDLRWGGGGGGTSYNKQRITLSPTYIANQYIDLAYTIVASSLDFVTGGVIQDENYDYTVNLTGGVGGVTRVTFIGALSSVGVSPLQSGDTVSVKYRH
jgi:hypothetical protein